MTSLALRNQRVAARVKAWPENQPTGKCWSCDAPDSPRHECDSGHVVWACEEQCRIVDEPSAIPGRAAAMSFEDCPLCQDEVREGFERQQRLDDLKDRHDADAFDREHDR